MEEYLRVKEAAAILAVSEQTVRSLIKTGALQSIRVGKRALRIPRSSVDDYAKNNNTKE